MSSETYPRVIESRDVCTELKKGDRICLESKLGVAAHAVLVLPLSTYVTFASS